MNQKEKSRFRRSTEWRNFKARMRKERRVDCITLHPLRKGHALHHMDLREENYGDLSDETRFEPLNRRTHEVVHWLYVYYSRDKGVIDRLRSVMDRMAEINGEKTEKK